MKAVRAHHQPSSLYYNSLEVFSKSPCRETPENAIKKIEKKSTLDSFVDYLVIVFGLGFVLFCEYIYVYGVSELPLPRKTPKNERKKIIPKESGSGRWAGGSGVSWIWTSIYIRGGFRELQKHQAPPAHTTPLRRRSTLCKCLMFMR
jgi:hypothetical protein